MSPYLNAGDHPRQVKMTDTCKVDDCQKRLLVAALRDTLCELTACANQLAARGLKGHEGDSVSRAQRAARDILAAVGGARE